MKFSPAAIFLAAAILALPASAPAQTAAAGEAEARKCEDRIDAAQRDVLNKYEDALNELQVSLQKAADLEGALAVRAEHARLTKDGTLTEKNFVGEPKALRALQAQTVAKVHDFNARLVAETLPKLVELKKQLTIAGKLDEALAVRITIERLQNGHVPVVRPDAGTVVPVDTLLLAYNGDRTRADQTYKGQKLTIHGVIGGFRQDPADGKNYQVFVTGGSGGWLQCTFGSAENRFREEKAFNTPVLVITGKDNESARLQKGYGIDVRGVCDGLDEVVKLNRCEVAK